MLLHLPSGLGLFVFASLCLTPTTTVASVISPAEYLDLFGAPTLGNTWTLRPEDLPNATNLKQKETNGKSLLGSLSAPTFSKFIPSRKRQTATPWGNRSTLNSDASSAPVTGTVRTYDFTIARSTLSPDGVSRPVILINGAFPGPTIEANWGDTIVVNVHNNMDNEGTSLHWHGLLQTDSNDQDGVPGVTQCPIAPGQSYTYTFQASSYGTSWYHAHYSAQYTSGLYGAMVIHGPTDNAPYDIDLGPVLLADYYYQAYYDIVQGVMGTDPSKIAPASDNNLINGKGIADCALVNGTCTSNAGLPQFQFQTGKKHRMRLINAGAEAIMKFSIDNHVLTVMAVDFIPIVPYQATVLTLAVGQRMDIVVEATANPTDSVYLRSIISSCSKYRQPNAFGLVYYPNADKTLLPSSTAQVDNTDPCAEEPIANFVPAYKSTPGQPELSHEIDVTINRNATGHFLWAMNNVTFRANYNQPPLQSIQSGASVATLPPDTGLFDFGSARSIQLVVNNRSPAPHPFHLHGYDFYVLAAGGTSGTATSGVTWDGSIVNAANPMRRDTFLLQPNGYMVIQINSINPGVWSFHCHIAWHVSGGLYTNLVTQTSAIAANVPFSSPSKDLCASWNAWSSTDYVDEIDSGL